MTDDPEAWLLDQYEATAQPADVHIARPIAELVDDLDDPGPFWSGSAQWPRPFLHADLDEWEGK